LNNKTSKITTYTKDFQGQTCCSRDLFHKYPNLIVTYFRIFHFHRVMIYDHLFIFTIFQCSIDILNMEKKNNLFFSTNKIINLWNLFYLVEYFIEKKSRRNPVEISLLLDHNWSNYRVKNYTTFEFTGANSILLHDSLFLFPEYIISILFYSHFSHIQLFYYFCYITISTFIFLFFSASCPMFLNKKNKSTELGNKRLNNTGSIIQKRYILFYQVEKNTYLQNFSSCFEVVHVDPTFSKQNKTLEFACPSAWFVFSKKINKEKKRTRECSNWVEWERCRKRSLIVILLLWTSVTQALSRLCVCIF